MDDFDERDFCIFKLKRQIDIEHKSIKRGEYAFNTLKNKHDMTFILLLALFESLRDSPELKNIISQKLDVIASGVDQEFFECHEVIQAARKALG